MRYIKPFDIDPTAGLPTPGQSVLLGLGGGALQAGQNFINSYQAEKAKIAAKSALEDDYQRKLAIERFQQQGRERVANIGAGATRFGATTRAGATIEAAKLREKGEGERFTATQTANAGAALAKRGDEFLANLAQKYPGAEKALTTAPQLREAYASGDAARIQAAEQSVLGEAAKWWNKRDATERGAKNWRAKQTAQGLAGKAELEAGRAGLETLKRAVQTAMANNTFFDREMPGVNTFYRTYGPAFLVEYGSKLMRGEGLKTEDEYRFTAAVYDSMLREARPGADLAKMKQQAVAASQRVLSRLAGMARQDPNASGM